jgi:hypothetical protein
MRADSPKSPSPPSQPSSARPNAITNPSPNGQSPSPDAGGAPHSEATTGSPSHRPPPGDHSPTAGPLNLRPREGDSPRVVPVVAPPGATSRPSRSLGEGGPVGRGGRSALGAEAEPAPSTVPLVDPGAPCPAAPARRVNGIPGSYLPHQPAHDGVVSFCRGCNARLASPPAKAPAPRR